MGAQIYPFGSLLGSLHFDLEDLLNEEHFLVSRGMVLVVNVENFSNS